MDNRCEICGIEKVYHKEAYHQEIENILRLIHQGYMPALLAWTRIKNIDDKDILSARYSDGAIWIHESLLEDKWRKKRISFVRWKSLIDRIKGGEPVWMVADQDTLAGAYLRSITQIYERSQDRNITAESIRIDLKWSLWTQDFGVWMDYAPQVYDLMRIVMDSTESLTVNSAPRKEIRFGSVNLKREGKAYTAEVDFWTEWDDANEIASSYDIGEDAEDEDYYDEFLNYILAVAPRNGESGLGVRITRTVRSKTFAGLMKKIDAVEGELLEEDERAGKTLDSDMTEYLEQIRIASQPGL